MSQHGRHYDLVAIARDVAIREGFHVEFHAQPLAAPHDADDPHTVD